MVMRFIAIYAISLLFAVSASAQHAPTPHAPPISVVVEKFDNQNLVVKTDTGKELSVRVPATATINRTRKVTAADIKTGQFVHSNTVDGPDGKLVATGIYVIPEAARGNSEGHFPEPNVPNASITNGNIDEIADVAGGRIMKVGYKGGQSEVKVPKDANVTISETASADALKPGTKIGLIIQEDPSGTSTALAILLGYVRVAQ